MSIVREKFYNIKCDRCGVLLDEDMWHAEKDSLECLMEENGFIEQGHKHYCQDCYEIDDDDNIRIKPDLEP